MSMPPPTPTDTHLGMVAILLTVAMALACGVIMGLVTSSLWLGGATALMIVLHFVLLVVIVVWLQGKS